MGKQSRSKKDRGRSRRTTTSLELSGGLKIVVATSPSVVDGEVSVHEDVRLVRSALLYADTVELVSPGAVIVASLAAASEAGPGILVDMLTGMDDDTLRYIGADNPQDMRAIVAQMQALTRMPREQRRASLGSKGARELSGTLRQFIDGLAESARGFDDVASNIFEKAGASELAVAADAGLLTLSTTAFDIGAQTDDQVAQYTESIKKFLGDPSAHLMFDERIASLAKSLVDEGRASAHPLTLDHSTRAATGAGLIARLPAFPDARMEAVIEARQELAEPLIRYRSGVRDLSDKLKTGPLDPALQIEIDDMWRDEVSPAVAEVQRGLTRTKLLRDAVLTTATDGQTLIGSGVVLMGVGSVTELSGAVTAGLVPTAAKIIKDVMTARSTSRSHELFYLAALDKRL